MSDSSGTTVPPTGPSDHEAALAAFDCNVLVERVTEYLEGSMSADEHARLERHLAACDGCEVYIEQFRQTIAVAGRLDPEAVSDEALDRLREIFQTSGRHGP